MGTADQLTLLRLLIRSSIFLVILSQVMPYWIKLLFLRWVPRLILFKRPPDPTPGSRKDGGRFDDPDYDPSMTSR